MYLFGQSNFGPNHSTQPKCMVEQEQGEEHYRHLQCHFNRRKGVMMVPGYPIYFITITQENLRPGDSAESLYALDETAS